MGTIRKPELRKQSRLLRKEGKSINEIVTILGIAKSTCSLWIRDIELSDDQCKELKSRGPKSYTLTEENRNARRIRQVDRISNSVFKNMCLDASHSKHFKIEKYALPFIEERFNTTGLKPEKIGDHWFDFCNDEYVIELTYNKNDGSTNAINRFAKISDDPRKKILICQELYFGEIRRSRLLKTGAEFVPLWFPKPDCKRY